MRDNQAKRALRLAIPKASAKFKEFYELENTKDLRDGKAITLAYERTDAMLKKYFNRITWKEEKNE